MCSNTFIHITFTYFNIEVCRPSICIFWYPPTGISYMKSYYKKGWFFHLLLWYIKIPATQKFLQTCKLKAKSKCIQIWIQSLMLSSLCFVCFVCFVMSYPRSSGDIPYNRSSKKTLFLLVTAQISPRKQFWQLCQLWKGVKSTNPFCPLDTKVTRYVSPGLWLQYSWIYQSHKLDIPLRTTS